MKSTLLLAFIVAAAQTALGQVEAPVEVPAEPPVEVPAEPPVDVAMSIPQKIVVMNVQPIGETHAYHKSGCATN